LATFDEFVTSIQTDFGEQGASLGYLWLKVKKESIGLINGTALGVGLLMIIASPTWAYTDSNGQKYTATQNDHGAVLTGKSETIYLGNSCDALSDAGEEGTWAWANGGFLIVFPKRRIGFPRQDQPVSGGYHCQI
jgi:hypothetical protein